MLCRKDLNITEKNKNENKDKFKFQGQYAGSQCWFDFDFDWIEENFSTHEPNFYKEIFQRHDETKDKNKFTMFLFPIGNANNVE